MLVNSSIRDLDSTGMSMSGKASAARPRQRGEVCSQQVQKSSQSENNDKRYIQREATWRWNLRGRRLSVREGELMRRRALKTPPCPGELCAWSPQAHVMCTPYEDGQGPTCQHLYFLPAGSMPSYSLCLRRVTAPTSQAIALQLYFLGYLKLLNQSIIRSFKSTFPLMTCCLIANMGSTRDVLLAIFFLL